MLDNLKSQTINHNLNDSKHPTNPNHKNLKRIKNIPAEMHVPRLVLMSATLDSDLFSKYFSPTVTPPYVQVCYLSPSRSLIYDFPRTLNS